MHGKQEGPAYRDIRCRHFDQAFAASGFGLLCYLHHCMAGEFTEKIMSGADRIHILRPGPTDYSRLKPVQRRKPTVGEQSSVGLTRLAGQGRSDSGAYGCNPTVLSTLRKPTLKVTHETEVHDTYCVVHFDGDGGQIGSHLFREIVTPCPAGSVQIE